MPSVSARLAPSSQEPLRIACEFVDDLGRRLHFLYPVDRLPGPVWHGRNRSTSHLGDSEALEAMDRERFAGDLIQPFADDLASEGLGCLDRRAQTAVGRIWPTNRKYIGV